MYVRRVAPYHVPFSREVQQLDDQTSTKPLGHGFAGPESADFADEKEGETVSIPLRQLQHKRS